MQVLVSQLIRPELETGKNKTKQDETCASNDGTWNVT